jgi:hypothetical protein
MIPNTHNLEQMVADRREDMLRAAEQARLARQVAQQKPSAPRPQPRVYLAGALRSLANRLEPVAVRATTTRGTRESTNPLEQAA